MKRYRHIIGAGAILLLIVLAIIKSILGTVGLAGTILLFVGIAGLVGYVILMLPEISNYFSRRSAKYSTNALASALIVLLILIIINAFAVNNNWRKDVTAAGQFSLAPQTIKVLKNLKVPVKATAFFRSNNKRRIEDLLKEYAYHSDKFEYEIVDPDKSPDIAKRYNITMYGTTVVESGGNREEITTVKEQDLTNAIIKVSREKKKVIYFVKGHGERDIDTRIEGNKGGDGFATAKEALEAMNFEVKSLLLINEDKVPEDCAVLVVPGPQTPFLQPEVERVKNYLNGGGKLLLMVDPEPGWDGASLVEGWGVEIHNDIVLDVSGIGQLFGAGPQIPIATSYGDHAITEDFRNMITAYPWARSLEIDYQNKPAQVTATKLVETSPRSWGETNIKNEKPVHYTEGKDFKGPLTLGVVLEREAEADTAFSEISGKKKKTRVIVFGDSDFATNAFFHVQRNGDLFLSMVSWLAEEEDLVSIRPREPEDRRVNMTKAQSRFVLIFGVIIFPALILLTGVGIYVKRRR
jgi:ABC-type uncharacterized transport system involved in gliding motility auxiliary subunit